jgi:hypothetical protein
MTKMQDKNKDQDNLTYNNRKAVNEDILKRVERISEEFKKAFDFIKDYTKSVTFFGSARVKADNPLYERAKNLAYKISKELGYAIVSGGGGGIMEASNRGAYEAGGISVGINIKLPKEQKLNQYISKSIDMSYFFVRKTALSFAAEAYVFFPGGFGTLDEFFEIITLIQTGKIPRVPVILVGKEYWQHIVNFMKECLIANGYIDELDIEIFKIAETDEEVIEIIKKAPIRIGLKK